MTDYKATPEQWALLQRQSQTLGSAESTALLELRARVEALEATSKPSPNFSQIGRSLVARVAIAISQCEDSSCWDDESVNWTPEARAAIREVAAWLREQQGGDLVAATVLEREGER